MLDSLFGKIFGKKQESMPVLEDLGALGYDQLKLYLRQYGCLTSMLADQIQNHSLYAAARTIQDHIIDKRLTGDANYLPTLEDIHSNGIDAEIDRINLMPAAQGENVSEQVGSLFDSWDPELNLGNEQDSETGENDSGIFEPCKSKPTPEGKQANSGSVNAPERKDDALFADARTFLDSNPEVTTDPDHYATARTFLSRESSDSGEGPISFMDASGEEIIVAVDDNEELPSGVGEAIYIEQNGVVEPAGHFRPATGRRFYTRTGLVLPAAAVFTALSLGGSLISGQAKPKNMPEYTSKQASEGKETRQAQPKRQGSSPEKTLSAEAAFGGEHVIERQATAKPSVGKIALETIDIEDPYEVHKWATFLHQMDAAGYREGQPIDPINPHVLTDGAHEYFVFDVDKGTDGIRLEIDGNKTAPLGITNGTGTYCYIRGTRNNEPARFKIIPLTKGEQK